MGDHEKEIANPAIREVLHAFIDKQATTDDAPLIHAALAELQDSGNGEVCDHEFAWHSKSEKVERCLVCGEELQTGA